MPSDHVTAASPVEPQPEVATDALALATGGIADRELIAALGIEAQIGIDLGRYAAAEFQPCRLLQQRHRSGRPGKGRRRVSAPVSPDIGPNIGLPDLSVVAGDGPLAADAEPPASPAPSPPSDRTSQREVAR